MDPFQIVMFILSLIIGYVLGAINPGYIIGRLKGIDIRKVGTKNPGTSNVWHTLGKKYGILTAGYDIFKSLIACIIAIYAFGVGYFFAQFSGILAIIGHCFPFYLRFRGGKGVASAIGMLPYYVSMYISSTDPWSFTMLYVVLYLLVIALLFIYISHLLSMLAWIIFPILGYSSFVFYPGNSFNWFFIIVLSFLIGFVTYSAVLNKKFPLEGKIFKADWIRMGLRLLTIFFLLFYDLWGKSTALVIIIIFGALFISIDLYRLNRGKVNEDIPPESRALYRKGESKKFSSISIYVVAFFMSVLIFPREIAFTATVYLIFGDIFGKIFGLGFGRHKLLNKTIEGTLAYFGCMGLCGYVLFTILNISPIILILGGIAAPITELLSLEMNDNFTVSLISGTVMAYTAFLMGILV
ncbi:MAG: glycerol-3-phosphate acyltransferase [Candidatus Hermodarchaeota archaeon]